MEALCSLFVDSGHKIGGANMKQNLMEKFHQRFVELAKQSISTGHSEAVRLATAALRTLSNKNDL